MGDYCHCDACDREYSWDYGNPHRCDPKDLAEKIESDAQSRQSDMDAKFERLESVVAILAEAVIKEREMGGYCDTYTISREDAQILRAFIAEQKDGQG